MEEEISSSGTSSPERRLWPRMQRRVERESDTRSTSSPVRHGTVRGRGRGRPAGRRGTRAGRGGGRGQRSRSEHRGDVAVAALQERQRNLQARIEEMTDAERRDLLLKTGEKHPEFIDAPH
uniref:Uncharacterized protein LOC111114685 isoform X1 n=2 Tax=Crassostrea virginica TaxID=6565 RepID=A0A8B8C142_CRAVI|nr:uncharacterized protein LOC111114685 isoform X1 [Crassostrea virginica]